MGLIGKNFSIKIVILTFALFLTASCGLFSNDDPSQDTFAKLDNVRDEEIESIIRHFHGLAEAARGIATDDVMLESFHSLLSTNAEQAKTKGLDQAQSQALDSHFVHRYGSFFDLLFIERGGYVFHSIKQESDHHADLFDKPLASTLLAANLKSDPGIEFVDFEQYGPSAEAASFFVTPVVSGEETQGWFILQYGSNELRAMLARRDDLGKSGEVYLVNQDRLMLSDSKFVNNSTVLRLATDTVPVKNAFEVGAGHVLASDYRGVGVFSSYDTLEFLGVTWAIIVEIDKDEVVSGHFRDHISDFTEELVLQAATKCTTLQFASNWNWPLPTGSRVDVNELRRIDQGETCWSPGVGPCTAVVAFYPGRFGYLLHIGPTDDVYTGDPLTRIILGTRRTGLMNDLQERITRFDIVGNDLGLLRYVVIATHTNSLSGILSSLLDNDIGLSQIKFAHDPGADYANVRYCQATDEVMVNWVKLGQDGSSRFSNASQLPNLSTMVNILDES